MGGDREAVGPRWAALARGDPRRAGWQGGAQRSCGSHTSRTVARVRALCVVSRRLPVEGVRQCAATVDAQLNRGHT